jgi:hypothetical protein
MRRNYFNEPVLQPDDDIADFWNDEFGESADRLCARFIEDDDGVWGCQLFDADEREVAVNDFPSEDALRGWLILQEVTIDE